ncbi:hypothetical protein V4B17_00130 [Bartonella sp. B23]
MIGGDTQLEKFVQIVLISQIRDDFSSDHNEIACEGNKKSKGQLALLIGNEIHANQSVNIAL